MMLRDGGDREVEGRTASSTSRAAEKLVRITFAFILLSIAVCYVTLRPSSHFVLLSPTIMSSLNFLPMGADPFVVEKSALERKLQHTYCHQTCMGQPSVAKQCSLCRLGVKKRTRSDVLSLLGYDADHHSESRQQLFNMQNLFPLSWLPQDNEATIEDDTGTATPLATITPRTEGGDWRDYRAAEGDPQARQEQIQWDSARNGRWERQGTDPQPWGGSLSGALDDGFLSARELPPLLLNQRLQAFCKARFPESRWQESACWEALEARVRGEAAPAHVRLNWDDEEDPAKVLRQREARGAGREAGGAERMIGEYVASLCMNEDALSAQEEALLCPHR